MGAATQHGILMSGGRSRFGTAFNNDVWLLVRPLNQKTAAGSTAGPTAGTAAGTATAAGWVQQPKAPFGERACKYRVEDLRSGTSHPLANPPTVSMSVCYPPHTTCVLPCLRPCLDPATQSAVPTLADHGMLELDGCVYVMGGQTFTAYLHE